MCGLLEMQVGGGGSTMTSGSPFNLGHLYVLDPWQRVVPAAVRLPHDVVVVRASPAFSLGARTDLLLLLPDGGRALPTPPQVADGSDGLVLVTTPVWIPLRFDGDSEAGLLFTVTSINSSTAPTPANTSQQPGVISNGQHVFMSTQSYNLLRDRGFLGERPPSDRPTPTTRFQDMLNPPPPPTLSGTA